MLPQLKRQIIQTIIHRHPLKVRQQLRQMNAKRLAAITIIGGDHGSIQQSLK